jgi:DNA processing protein
LSQRIAQQGLLVSEFPLGAPVVKANFPRRNRIIAGLSQAVVVVEAGERSGALITARNALEQNREILAMPGPPDSPQHTGVFQLLRDGAHLCATPNDLLQVLGWQQPLRSVAPSASPVVKLLSHKSATAEELAVLLCRTIPELQAELVLLELSGEIVRLSGGRYAPAP